MNHASSFNAKHFMKTHSTNLIIVIISMLQKLLSKWSWIRLIIVHFFNLTSRYIIWNVLFCDLVDVWISKFGPILKSNHRYQLSEMLLFFIHTSSYKKCFTFKMKWLARIVHASVHKEFREIVKMLPSISLEMGNKPMKCSWINF